MAHQAPLSIGFPKPQCWSGLPLPSPGDLPNPGIEPRSPVLEADSLPTELQGKSPSNSTCLMPCTSSFFSDVIYLTYKGFPGGLDGKESASSAGRRPRFNPWVRKIPWRREWQPTLAFLPGESHGQRNLAGYSPWGCRVGHNWATNMTISHIHNSRVWLQILDSDYKFFFSPPHTHPFKSQSTQASVLYMCLNFRGKS